MAANPAASPETVACERWIESVLQRGTQIVIPEITDYEVRRELIRAGKTRGVARLDALKQAFRYLPLTTAMMLLAAQFWATARNTGKQTAPDNSLDGDMILAAQVVMLGRELDEVVIATTNIKHLGLFANAGHWKDIR